MQRNVIAADDNNRMLHPKEVDLIKNNAARFAKELYGTDSPTQDQITAATSVLANTAQSIVDYNLGYSVPHSAQAEKFLQKLQSEYAAISPNLSIGNDQYLFYATNDQKNSPFINSDSLKNSGFASSITKTPITQPYNGPVYSASNPFNPVTPCISADCIPVGRPGVGPDYLSVSANFYLFSGGAAINLHNGEIFGQWGVGRSYPSYSIAPGGSIVFGNIVGGASAQKTSDFLRGAGSQGSIMLPLPGFPLIGTGGGVGHSYSGGTSIEYGIGTPGSSITPVGYGINIDKIKNEY